MADSSTASPTAISTGVGGIVAGTALENGVAQVVLADGTREIDDFLPSQRTAATIDREAVAVGGETVHEPVRSDQGRPNRPVTVGEWQRREQIVRVHHGDEAARSQRTVDVSREVFEQGVGKDLVEVGALRLSG